MSNFLEMRAQRLETERAQLLEKRATQLERGMAIADKGVDNFTEEDSASLAGINQSIKEIDSRLTVLEGELGIQGETRSDPPAAPKRSFTPSRPGRETRSDQGILAAFLRVGSEYETRSDRDLLFKAGCRNLNELELRASILTSASPGSNVIQKGFLNRLIEQTVDWCDFLKICTVIPTDKGNELKVPVDTDNHGTYATGALIGEGVDDTEKNIEMSEIALYAYVASSGIVTCSWEAMTDAEISIEQHLTNVLARRLGRRLSNWFTLGTGSGQPKGIVHGVGSTGIPSGQVASAGATTLTLDNLMDAMALLDPSYQRSPKLRWMMAMSTLAYLRKIKDSQGRYIVNDPVNGGFPTIFGVEVVVNSNVSAIGSGNTSVILGDFSQYFIRQVKDFRFVRSDERYFEARKSAFVGLTRADGRIANGYAFAAITHA